MKALKTAITKATVISLCLVISALPVNANSNDWSKSDNRCPRGTERYKREVGGVTGQGGTYYWCYWYDGIAHNISMRPVGKLGGFVRSITPESNIPRSYYRNYLIYCAQRYVDNWGFCGAV